MSDGEYHIDTMVYHVIKPDVNDIDTDVEIKARCTLTGKTYSGYTTGWSCVIKSFDLHRMCVDGFEGKSVNSVLTIIKHLDLIELKFNITSYAISFILTADLKLEPAKAIVSGSDIQQIYKSLADIRNMMNSVIALVDKLQIKQD